MSVTATSSASRVGGRAVARHASPGLAAALFVLAAGAATSALLGPLVGGVIRYRVSENMLNQVTGADAVTLALVAPVALAAGVLALRGHPAAPVLALAPALFAVYTFTQLVLGGEPQLPGNAERFFPLHLLVFVAGGVAVVAAWSAVEAERLPALGRRRRRALATLLLVVSAFLVVGLHVPGPSTPLGTSRTVSSTSRIRPSSGS